MWLFYSVRITPAGNLCIQKFQISNFYLYFLHFYFSAFTFFINSILVYTSFTAAVFFVSTFYSSVLFIATGNSFFFFSSLCECVCFGFSAEVSVQLRGSEEEWDHQFYGNNDNNNGFNKGTPMKRNRKKKILWKKKTKNRNA